jgi:hypothetical protein
MDKGSCNPIIEADRILDHFQVMLKDAHWGYWKRTWPNQGNHSNIKGRYYFDDAGTMFQVLEVSNRSIVAKLFFTRERWTFHDKPEVASAIAQKQGVKEIYN